MELTSLKQCSRCKQTKSREQFSRWSRGKDGLATWCKFCKSEYQRTPQGRASSQLGSRTYHARHFLKSRASKNAWKRRDYQLHRPKHIAKVQQRIAKYVNAPGGGVSPEQWIDRLEEFNGHCAYCQQPVNSPEMEHMQPLSKGGAHVIENVIPACRKCNASKGDKSLLEFIAYQSGVTLTHQMPVAA